MSLAHFSVHFTVFLNWIGVLSVLKFQQITFVVTRFLDPDMANKTLASLPTV